MSVRSDRRTVGRVWRAAVLAAALWCVGVSADAEAPRRFDIPSQDLGEALKVLSATADAQLLFAAELVNGKRSKAMAGEFTLAAALTQLLEGTGLDFSHTRSGVILIVERAEPAPTDRAPVIFAPVVPAHEHDVTPVAEIAQASQPPTQVFEIEVNGTRIGAPELRTLQGEELDGQGATNVLQVLNQTPVFKATTTPTTNGVRAATPGASYVDLRGLGSSRTLVLVDGKRFVPQIATMIASYQVDLNQIPALIVERIETRTGGPTAEWGSDALAGVVNLVLRKDFEGLRTDLQAGGSAHGDDREYRAGVLAGARFSDGRGHVVGAVDYVRNDGTGDVYSRPWGQAGYQLAGNPCSVLASPELLAVNGCDGQSNGLAQLLIVPDVRFGNMSPGGLILDTPLRGTQFGSGGEPLPFEFGAFANAGATMQGGDPVNLRNNINAGVSMANYVRRLGTYGRVSYEFSDGLTAYLEASFASSTGGGQTLPARDAGPLVTTIYADSAFLPASIRDFMIENGIDSFRMGRVNRDIGYQQMRQDNDTLRVVAGAQGTLPGDWTWETSLVYGENDYRLIDAPNRIVDHYRWAVDAVRDPSTGDVVCRVALHDPLSACVPLNPFGEGSPSRAAIDYVTALTWQETRYLQRVLAAQVTGTPFRTWAGPVSIASGVEYRSERQRSRVDPIAAAQRYEATNARPLDGGLDVAEAYVKASVPLVKSHDGSEALAFEGALRMADYSTVGTQVPWKAGLIYRPIETLTLRTTLSRDIRAPNIFELYSEPLSTTINIAYRGEMIQAMQDAKGNPDLRPETARTFTAGATWRPAALPALKLSLDYFRIDVEDFIGQRNLQQIAHFCSGGTARERAFYCSLLTFADPNDPFSLPTRAQVPYENLSRIVRSGLDFSAAYQMPAGRGLLSMNFDASFTAKYQTDMGAGLIERAGDMQGSPKLRATLSLGYQQGPWSVNALTRYLGDMRYDNTFVEGLHINDNDVPSVAYVDLSARLDSSANMQWFAVIRNAFDTAPPYVPTAFGYPTNPIFYDMIGRTYRVGVRYQFRD
jgi:iron complex outermembrane receptor protein